MDSSPLGPVPQMSDAQALLQRAEAQWQLRSFNDTNSAGDLSASDTIALVHNFQVHQIELEMQNEELRTTQEKLAVSRQRYIDLYELAPVGYCSVSQAGLLVQSNQTLANLLGVARDDLLNWPFANFVSRQDLEVWHQLRLRLIQSGARQAGELRLRQGLHLGPMGGDGHLVWVHLAVTQTIDETGKQRLQIAVSDISTLKVAAVKLQLADNVFDNTREGITVTDAQGTMIEVNQAFSRITGYSREEALGQNPRILKSGRQDTSFYTEMWLNLTDQGHWSGEIWNRRKSGEVYAQLLTISAIRDPSGVTQQYVALFSDISVIKEHQNRLEHIAHFDALTNLPNRVLLADRLQQAMAQAQRRGLQLAVVYLDLDGFKQVNDSHGHEVGDELLIALSNAMKDTMREGDTLARMGGDEFVAVLIDLQNISSCLPMLDRLLGAAASPVRLGELSLRCSASLGVTFYAQDQDIDADQLLRQADQAMYQAKVAGKNRYHIFDAAHDNTVRGHHESLERIRLALAQGELLLHYQPKVNMRTGQVLGAEALIRWQHPEKGLLAPAEFLPVIEDHPLAVDVGEWVIDTTLTQMACWQAGGLKLQQVSVNVGARQLQQGDFVRRLKSILANHPQVNPANLQIEVLETSALSDMVQVSQVIEDCARIGVMFALDDFGTGYSSLTYLKRLRVSLLKIDQSFVRDMLDDPDDLAILEGVIGLAAAFKRQVIAEGVETVAHGTALSHLGCELAQGYGIARPMPGAEMPAWAASWLPDAAWSKA